MIFLGWGFWMTVSFSYVHPPRSEGKAHENGGTTKDSPKRQDEIVHQHQQNYGPDLVHHSAKHHLAVELSPGIDDVSLRAPIVENYRIQCRSYPSILQQNLVAQHQSLADRA